MNRHRYVVAMVGVVVLLAAPVAPRRSAAADVAVPTGPARETPSARTQHYAIMLSGKKIGHAIGDFKVVDGKAVTVMTMVMQFQRQQLNIEVRVKGRTVETLDGKPISFVQTMKSSLFGQKVEGRVDKAGTLHATITVGGQKSTRKMPWPKGAILNYGKHLVTLEKGFKEGTTYTVRSFDIDSLAARETKTTVGGRMKVDLLGRTVMLTEARSVVAVGGNSLTVVVYVDSAGRELKTVTSMIGMKLELIACGKKVALASNDVLDMFDRVLLASPVALDNLGATTSVSYVLAPTKGEAKLKFLATDNQRVKPMASGQVRVTVAPAAPPKKAAMPYKGTDAEALAALKPSRFVQSDSAKVMALAKEAVGQTKNAPEAARRIQKFVNTYISKKNLSVGYATAAEVAETRQGDCTEHAVLTAAMCRAVGIPARVVTGMAYASQFAGRRNVFGPHAWNEVYLAGKWIGLDATQGRYDAGRVALAQGDGDADGLLALVNTLGCFKIVRIEPSERR